MATTMTACSKRMHEATANIAGAPCHCGKYRLVERTSTRTWLSFERTDLDRTVAAGQGAEHGAGEG